jgi:hypothetical protein
MVQKEEFNEGEFVFAETKEFKAFRKLLKKHDAGMLMYIRPNSAPETITDEMKNTSYEACGYNWSKGLMLTAFDDLTEKLEKVFPKPLDEVTQRLLSHDDDVPEFVKELALDLMKGKSDKELRSMVESLTELKDSIKAKHN